MALIRQLSPHVADLIAAGEVVERPGSVVKELLENAVDAGAKHVAVEIQNGGMTFLRVTDDGCGMAPDDAETAFLRHATSKLRAEEDLAAITTLGFRGEALAAIASVSRIDLLTRTAGELSGTSLRLESGAVVERGDAGCPVGTTLIVRDLFYNTPARMKFMKSDAAESSNVFAVVQNQALCHPDVAFRFLKDGQEQLSTPGDGSLQSAIYRALGRQFALDLVEVESRWEQYRLHGFVTKPSATRGNRLAQRFFVAGRPVKSKLLSSALERAYQNQLLAGRFPGCVLMLELPPRLVDVNVHPAKTEVRFLSEKEVFDAVQFGVLGALSRAPGRPEMKLKTPAASRPPITPQPPAAPQPPLRPPEKKKDFYQTMDAARFREFVKAAAEGPKPDPSVVQRVFSLPDEPPQKDDFLASPQKIYDPNPPPEPEQLDIPLPEVPDWLVVGEALDTYIIVEQAGTLLFLDKHAAHERILFEKLRANRDEVVGQTLIAPLPVRLGREEAAALLENDALLRSLGFEAIDFGGSVALQQIPAELDASQAEATVQELAAQLLEGGGANLDALRDRLLHTVACKAAIKAGWHTDPRERDALVREVLTRDDIKYCPHGRPVCVTLTRAQLEKQFKRS